MALVGSLLVNLGLKSASFDRKIKRSQTKVQRFAQGVKNAAKRMVRFGMAMGAVGVAVGTVMVKNQLKAVDTIGKLSDSLGISTQALVALEHAAEITGTSVEGVHKGIEIFVRRLGEARQGLGEGKEALKKLGFEADRLISLGTEEAFYRVVDAIRQIPDAAGRAYAAYGLFGRQGVQLLNLIAVGRRGLMGFRRETEMLRLSLSRVEAKQVEQANDALNRMKKAITGIVRQVTIKLAPVIEAIAKTFTKWATKGEGLASIIAKGAEEFVLIVWEMVEALKDVATQLGKINDLAGKLKRGWQAGAGFLGFVQDPVTGLHGLVDKMRKGQNPVGEALFEGIGKPPSETRNKIKALFAALRTEAAAVVATGRKKVAGTGGDEDEDLLGETKKGGGSWGVLDRTRMSLAGLMHTVIDPQKQEQIDIAKMQLAVLQAINRGQGLR